MSAFAFFVAMQVAADAAEGIPDVIAVTMFIVGIVAIPLAVAVAILRYRLYDIDVIINRALVYAILSALLGGGYVLSVLAVQAVLGPITAGSEIAVAASTLIVVALFGPLRRRIQRVVDRRFYRFRYDAARTIEAFGQRLRQELALDTLTAELEAVVDQTIRPTSVSVWVRDQP